MRHREIFEYCPTTKIALTRPAGGGPGGGVRPDDDDGGDGACEAFILLRLDLESHLGTGFGSLHLLLIQCDLRMDASECSHGR